MSNAAQYIQKKSNSDRKHPAVAELLRTAELPDAVSQRIDSIIRATKLWPSEREEIARELIAHAQDAIKAKTTPEATAEALGDPATIGQLLRRSVRRKRPLHWQIRYRAYQAIGVALLLMFFSYSVLFVRFNTGSPAITINYLAQLNERRNAYAKDQYAITAFEALRRAWAREVNILTSQMTANDSVSGITFPQHEPRLAHNNIPHSSGEHLHYDLLLEAHQRLLPLIDNAAQASHLPALGVLYTDRFEDFIDEDGVQIITPLPPTEDLASSGMMIEVMLYWPIAVRQSAQLFAFDALLAARNGDADRAALSLVAVFNTARLIGHEHTLIASLVALAVQGMGEETLLRILHQYPGVLRDHNFRDIAHAASASASIVRQLDFETERKMFNDFVQRAYTQNADGDGRLTRQGIALLNRLTGPDYAEFSDAFSPNPATPFVGPLAMVTYGTRRDQEEMYDRLILLAEAMLQKSPGSTEFATLHERNQTLSTQLQGSARYWMVERLAPAFDRSVSTVHIAQAHTNATLVTIALHIHHQRTGQWPATLDELVPGLLPRIPDDPFDPAGQIKYRLIDNTPFVYFIGSNGVDNGGTHPKSASQIRSIRSLELRYRRGYPYGFSPDPTVPANQGDWIICPPQDGTE